MFFDQGCSHIYMTEFAFLRFSSANISCNNSVAAGLELSWVGKSEFSEYLMSYLTITVRGLLVLNEPDF